MPLIPRNDVPRVLSSDCADQIDELFSEHQFNW